MKSLRLLLFALVALGLFSTVACHKKHEKCSAYDKVATQR